jgi:Raf kinase inhibitor-like YbhB/YbcL family protein
MKVVSREGVKTVNGKKLPPPGRSDVRSFRDMDLSRDGSVVHGLWEFRWFLNASTSVSGSLLYAGKPVPFPEKDADPVHQRTPWGMVTHSNVSETSGKWSGGWFPREPDGDQPALLPIPVMLAMGEDLNPHKSGTHKSGGWVYEYTIENRGTWSVKRTGKLTFGGEAVDANVGQWMVTPWGVMQVFDGRNVHGWLPEEALGRSLSLVWSDQIISPPVKRRVRALKTDLDNLAIAVTYRGPDAGHGPDAGRRGCPFSALLHTDDAARSVLYGTQLLKIEPKLAAKLIDAMARSGVLDVATDPRRANIKWPKGPCYMIRVGQTGLGANASYVWNAGWDLTTLDHIRNLARAAGYNKAATVLEKVVQTVPDQEKTKWTRKATRDARMELTSPAFEDGQPIPEQYTGEGKDVSPALKWSNPPEGTEEFALICEDPDAPREEPWVHWVIYGIPKAAQGLPAEMPEKEQLPEGKLQGVNSFGEGQVGYGGPMPPEGHGPHRYIFTLYALDSKLDLKPGLSKQELLRAIDGHAVAETTLTGTYERK